MKETVAETVIEAGATLGEGCCWDHAKQRLYWLDILNCEVHIYDPATGEDAVHKTPYHVTLVHPTTKGDLILGTKMGIARMDAQTGAFQELIDPEADIPTNRFNDGKPGPDGRLYAGTIAYDGSDKKANFWRIEKDLSYSRLIDHVGNSNGLAWSPDETTLYWIDTKTNCVFAFDWDKASGDISNRRVAVEVPKTVGHPDGMTIDSDGMLWTALWGGYGVARWNPANGELLQKVTCSAQNVTCPSFGGPGLDVLYFTTAIKGRDTSDPSDTPGSGNVFCAKPGARGLPGYVFDG